MAVVTVHFFTIINYGFFKMDDYVVKILYVLHFRWMILLKGHSHSLLIFLDHLKANHFL